MLQINPTASALTVWKVKNFSQNEAGYNSVSFMLPFATE
jgi:hypothetical protein